MTQQLYTGRDPSPDEREEAALRIVLSSKMIQKRQRLDLTQRQASTVSGISYGTYLQAETYARMGKKVIEQVKRWVDRPDEKDRSKITAVKSKTTRKGMIRG